MFHILIENSTPNRLVGGPWTGVNFSSSDVAASILECGLKGGQVREALSHSDVRGLISNNRLKKEQACKVCLRKVINRYGKTKD